MDELIRQFFLKTREDYVHAVHWSVLLVSALAFLHLTTFSQYLQTQAAMARARSDKERLAAARAHQEKIAAELHKLKVVTVDDLQQRLAALLEKLRGDFTAVNWQLDQLLSAPGELPAHLGPPPGMLAATPNMPALPPMAQMPQASPAQISLPQDAGAQPELLFPADLRDEIKGAGRNGRRIRELLSPFIEEQIIRPRFAEAQRGWQTQQVPQIDSAANALSNALAQTEANFAEERARLEIIRAGVQRIAAESARLHLQPPGKAEWWQTVGGKMAELERIRAEADPRLTDAAAEQALAEWRRQTDELLAANAAVESALTSALRKIEANFIEQQKIAAKLAKPFEFIALDLDFLARRLPVLIGLAVGASLGWTARPPTGARAISCAAGEGRSFRVPLARAARAFGRVANGVAGGNRRAMGCSRCYPACGGASVLVQGVSCPGSARLRADPLRGDLPPSRGWQSGCDSWLRGAVRDWWIRGAAVHHYCRAVLKS